MKTPNLKTTLRLEELAKLKDGWLDGEGIAPSPNALAWLSGQFERCYELNIHPYLYPTPDGNITAEWTTQTWSISLDIDLKEKKGNLHALNLKSDKEETQSFDLSRKAGWDRLNQTLAPLIEPELHSAETQ